MIRWLMLPLIMLFCVVDCGRWFTAACLGQDGVEVVVEVAAEDQPIEMKPEDFPDPLKLLLQRHVRIQSALARRCCDLSDEQEQGLDKLDDDWLTQQIAENQVGPAQAAAVGIARFLGGRLGGGGRAVAENDPQKTAASVKRKVEDAIASVLTDEQSVVWREEIAAREKFNKEAQAAVLVAALDSRLFLSAEQRDELEPLIVDWLTKSDDLYCQFYLQNENYLPDIPKKVLAQVLSREQIASLDGAQTYNYLAWQMEFQGFDQNDNLIER